MKHFLEQLKTGTLDMQSEVPEIEESEIVTGDIELEVTDSELASSEDEVQVVEETTAIDATADTAAEDTVTLESLISGMRAVIANKTALTAEGAIFASNHVQAIAGRYNIEFAPNVNNESMAANASEGSRLTLEAAEQTEKSLWQRFKSMVIAGFNAVVSFIAGLFRTTAGYKKLADSVSARAIKAGDASGEIEVKGNAALFFRSLGVTGDTDGGKLAEVAKAGQKALDKVCGDLASKVKTIAAAEPKKADDEKAADAAVKESAVAVTEAVAALAAGTKLPFGKVITATDGVASLTTDKEALNKEAFKAKVTGRQLTALAIVAKSYLGSIETAQNGFKAYKKLVEDALKAGDADGVTGKLKKGWARQTHKMRAGSLSRSLASLAKASAAVLLQVAGAGLKKVEAAKA